MARKRGKRLLIALLCLTLAVPAGFGIYRLIDYLTTTSGDYRFVVLKDGTAEIRNYRDALDFIWDERDDAGMAWDAPISSEELIEVLYPAEN